MSHAVKESWDLLRALDAQFAFLLALFFAVALTGLIAEWVRHRLHLAIDDRTR